MQVALAPTPPPTGLNFINRLPSLPPIGKPSRTPLAQSSPITTASDSDDGSPKHVLGGWRDSGSEDQSEEGIATSSSEEIASGARRSFGVGGMGDNEIVFGAERKSMASTRGDAEQRYRRSSNDEVGSRVISGISDDNSRRQSTSSISSSSSTATTTNRQSSLSFNHSQPTADTTIGSLDLSSGTSPLKPGRDIPLVAITPSSDRSRGGSTTSSVNAPSPTPGKRINSLRKEEMDAAALQRWTKSASMGGIGKAIAVADNVAETPGDLMFLTGDEIVVLKELDDGVSYLGFCEGVLGRFLVDHVRFNSGVVARKAGERAAAAAIEMSSEDLPTTPETGDMIDEQQHQTVEDISVTPATTIPESSSMASVSTAADFFVTAPSPPTSPNTFKPITSVTEVMQSQDHAPTAGSLASPTLPPSPIKVTCPVLEVSTPPDDGIAYDFMHRASHRASNPFDLDLVSSSDGDERSVNSVPSRLPSPLGSDGKTRPVMKPMTSFTSQSSTDDRQERQEVAPSKADTSEDAAQQTLRSRRGAGPDLALVEEAARETSATMSSLMSASTTASTGGMWTGIGWMMADVAESPSPSNSMSPISPFVATRTTGGANEAQPTDVPSAEEKRRTRLNRRTGRLFSQDSLSPVLSDVSAMESLPSYPPSSASKLASVAETAQVEVEEPQWEMVGGPTEKLSTPTPDAADIVAHTSSSTPLIRVISEGNSDVGKTNPPTPAISGSDDDELASDEEEWDIYAEYARESMFLPPGSRLSSEQRKSLRAAARASRIKSGRISRMKASGSPLREVETSPLPSVGVADVTVANDGPTATQPAQVATPGTQEETSSPAATQSTTKVPPLPPKAEARLRAVQSRAISKEAGAPSPTATPLETMDMMATMAPTIPPAVEPAPLQSSPVESLVPTPQDVSPQVTTPAFASSASSPSKLEDRLGPSTPASVPVTPRSYPQSPATPISNYSPHTTSIGATKIAQSRRDVSLHGELAQNLTSAKNPVPIQFLVGDAMFIRSRVAVQQYRLAEPSPQGPSQGAARIGLGLGLPTHPGPSSVQQSSSAHARPAPHFTQANMERPRSKSFSSLDRIEVPLPMHTSSSSNSLTQAYEAGGDTSAVSRAATLMRKVSRKRSNSSATSRNNKPSEPVPATPKLPTSARSPAPLANAQWPIPTPVVKSQQLPQTPAATSPSPVSKPQLPPLRMTLSPVVALPFQGRSPLDNQGSPRSPATPPSRFSPLESALTRTKSAVSKSPRTPLTPPTASPISSKDYHRTVKQDGAEFQMAGDQGLAGGSFTAIDRSGEPDQWGFVGNSPVPVIYGMTAKEKKALPKLEQTLLSLIAKQRSPSSVKKVVKLVLESSIPPSIRTKVWAWLLADPSQPRPSAPFHQLAARCPIHSAKFDGRDAIKYFYSHHVFAHGGQRMVPELMVVYALTHSKVLDIDTSWIAAILLTKSFDAEEAYSLYDGLVTRMRPVLAAHNVRLECAVIMELLSTVDGPLAKKLGENGVLPLSFVSEWYNTLFAHNLPYPTVLRVFDLVIADGSTWILRIALAVLTLSSKRLLQLADGPSIVRYLLQPPPDELLAPDNLVKAAVKLNLSESSVAKIRMAAGPTVQTGGTAR